ncbi:aspartate carbamoyltransferase regulatory subunit [Candidatus Woesearchaeota archaeon]|nr:aspartate carbamoyltransferase regulatory subunit [Candidatus Woesearchaeota archaeon]
MPHADVENKMRLDLIDMENVRSFKGRDLLRVTDLTRDEVMYLLETGRVIANEMRKNRGDLSKSIFNDLGKGYRGATTFFEPSTRTHDSSLVAMTNLGMRVPVMRRSVEGTSQKKSESLAHDLFMYATYGVHAIVMRHPCEGAPQWAADYLDRMAKAHDKVRPVIVNGGDGAHCHPTQALLDALAYYMLYFVDQDGKDLHLRGVDMKNVMSGLTLYGVGDSLKGRTIKDNARLLAKFGDNELVLVGPAEIRMPQQDIKDLERAGMKVTVLEDVPSALEHAKSRQMPIFYFMRVQEERLDPRIVASVRGKVSMNKQMLKDAGIVVQRTAARGSEYQLKKKFPMFHPLPMHKEHRDINPDLENTQHFKCFDEAEMGPYIRSAIIGLTTGILKTSIAQPYVDERMCAACAKYKELPFRRGENGTAGIFRALSKAVSAPEGKALFNDFAGLVKRGEDPATAFAEFLSDMTKEKDLWEKYRHITFRFISGEEGTVIDHIENGLTGLIKFQLGLSDLIGQKGCDGHPIIVSAVDGLDSSKYGLKGVIKIRGALLPPDSLHYCYLLSNTEMTLSHVKDGRTVAKWTPTLPEVLKNFINCKNPLCISRQAFGESVPTLFYRDKGEAYRCRYCDTVVERKEMRKLLIKGG